MNEWINERVHERMDELVNERMHKCINECCFVLCCAVLWYGQSAQTFYMCLESLVSAAWKEFWVPVHTFRLTERFYEDSLSIFGPMVFFLKNSEALWSILKQLWSHFDATFSTCFRKFEAMLKHLWSNFEAHFEARLKHI